MRPQLIFREDIIEREFNNLGANGTPYLIVLGHSMKDDFDSDEFVALLSQWDGGSFEMTHK